MTFHNPFVLLLLPFAVLAVFYAHRRNKSGGFRFSSGELLSDLKSSLRVVLSRRLYLLRILSVVFLIVALTRPQSPIAHSKIEAEGIDIVLVLDSSTSMLAEDFIVGGRRESRIEVVKNAVRDFIKARKNDRIGIVTFAARAYTVCPLTLDYDWLLKNIDRIKSGMIEDGTAIGSGIASSLNRLKDTKAKSKVIILLTDGRNNAGKIAPLTAAEAALALKVKIYTIGAGSKGLVPYPVRDFFGNKVYQQVQVDIDEDTLMKIASVTAGKYFRATDTQSLRDIYSEIDKLEKTAFEHKGYLEYNELFPVFLIPGLIFLLMEMVLSNTYLRKLP
ncbi:MAG: VWA domain-containing protein [Candidatus Omnitrophota bacterium]